MRLITLIDAAVRRNYFATKTYCDTGATCEGIAALK